MAKKQTTVNRYIGGILLVSGTTIGAGMLAIPISTASNGFFPSVLIFLLCWAFMLATAFFFLHVNLSIEGDINLITMAHKTLGRWGRALSWIVYLLLLYSLIAAYIAASASVFRSAVLNVTHFALPHWICNFFLPVIFGGFVYLGTKGVDLVNRILMIGLVVAFALTIVVVPSHVQESNLLRMDWNALYLTVPIIITSFGYHIIIPSLSNYMNHDRKHLVHTLVIGSIVPLVFYLIWQLLVLGAVPLDGPDGLHAAWKSGVSATTPLSKVIPSKLLRTGVNFFAFFAIVTSFLGVSLSLSDFLIDGFRIKKTWEGRLLAMLLVFLPPLIFVFSSERGFILALEYAGAFIAILLGFLPSAMAWTLPAYKKPWKRVLLVFCIATSFVIVALTVAVTK
jgi:tyrosine-specific transport protein